MINSTGINSETLEAFNKYLTRTTEVFLDVEETDMTTILAETKTQDNLTKFLTDSQQHLLIISAMNTENEQQTEVRFCVDLELLKLEGQAVAFVKKVGSVQSSEKAIKFKKIFHVLNLGELSEDFNPYDLTHVCIKNAFVPIFNRLKRINPSTEKINSKITLDSRVISQIQKKLSDLDITLIQNNKMIEIPEVKFQYNPEITEFVEKCKASGEQPAVENFPAENLDDIQFVSQLTNSVTKWHQMLINLLNQVEKFEFDSVLDEIQFYNNYLQALESVEKQIESPETDLTKKILKDKKRYHSVASFENDVNFKTHITDVKAIADFMKGIPINDLLASNDMKDVRKSLDEIWLHFQKLTNLMAYSHKKCLNLIESLSKDLSKLLINILREVRLLDLDYAEFTQFYDVANSVFVRWNYGMTQLKGAYRKNRSDRNTNSNFNVGSNQDYLKARVEKIQSLREQHENLRDIFQEILIKEKHSNEKSNLSNFMKIQDIDKAFEYFYEIDILDVSNKGKEVFEATKRKYEADVDSVEKTIINKIREKLGAASDASEMFRVFSKFSSLLKRPEVKSAIFEYQDTLIKSFNSDLEELRDKFKGTYSNSGSKIIAQFYDIPDLTGSVIWNYEINRKLKKSIGNLGSVMGDDWTKTPTGKKIVDYEDYFSNALKEGD